MSSTRQAVIRGPSFTGRGKRPDLTPSHQVDFPTGIKAGIGCSVRESPIGEGEDNLFQEVAAYWIAPVRIRTVQS
jgi:hypothetical protein